MNNPVPNPQNQEPNMDEIRQLEKDKNPLMTSVGGILFVEKRVFDILQFRLEAYRDLVESLKELNKYIVTSSSLEFAKGHVKKSMRIIEDFEKKGN